MDGEFFGERNNIMSTMYQSKFHNILNIIFLKCYKSIRASNKIFRERLLYYKILSKNHKSLVDYGVIFRFNNSCYWLRRWRRGTFLLNNNLNSTHLEQAVDKLISIHNLTLPAKILNDLKNSKDVISWYDAQSKTSFFEEWKKLKKKHSETNCLVHGDFQPKKHLLVKEKQVEIIDFGDSFWGQPSVDLGALACSNPEIFDDFFKLYNVKTTNPISIEMVLFWKKYYESSNMFWMSYKFGIDIDSNAYR